MSTISLIGIKKNLVDKRKMFEFIIEASLIRDHMYRGKLYLSDGI